MKYGNREIADIPTEELWTISIAFQKTLDTRSEAISSARGIRRFAKQATPSVNPVFLELHEAINNELKQRDSVSEDTNNPANMNGNV
jgi:hypothetical protein